MNDAMDDPLTTKAPPRLDLFAFPSETRGRFQMLIVATLLLGLHLASAVWEATTDNMADLVHLQNAVSKLRERPDEPLATPEAVRQARLLYRDAFREIAAVQVPRWLNLAGHLGLLITAAAFFYKTHPWRLRRTQKPLPLSLSEAPSVVGYLQRCAETFGIPHLRIEHRRKRVGEGLSYGPKKQEALLLHGAPSTLEKSWDDVTKAIALHELGHIVNGDVEDREKAKAVWLGLLLYAALFLFTTLGLQLVYQTTGWVTTELRLLGPLFGTLLVIRLIWAGLIRNRELSADWRVASWGLGETLDRLLQACERQSTWWQRWPLWHSMERWWKLHPTYQMRRLVLADPKPLFQISPDLAFVTGLLLALMTVYVVQPTVSLGLIGSGLIYGWAVDLPMVYPLSLLPIVLLPATTTFALSYLLTATLGIQAQKEAVADLAQRAPRTTRTRGYVRLFVPAILFPIGVETGFLMAPLNRSPSLLAQPETALRWLLGLTLFTWLWLVYIRAATRLSLGIHVGKEQPRGRSSLILLTTILFWPVAAIRFAFTGSASGFGHWREQMMGTATLLGFCAAAIYVLWAGTGLGLAGMRLWIRRPRCPVCGEEVRHGFPLGKTCALCGEELTPWAFAGPPREPNCTEVDRVVDRISRGAPDARQSRLEAWVELAALALGLARISHRRHGKGLPPVV